MSRHVETIDADESIQAAAERMRASNVGSLPVAEHGRLVGIVTDRDLVVRALARGSAATSTVRAAMSRGLVTCQAEDDVCEAARTMARAGVRRLLVVDRDLEVVGVISVDDLAMHGCGADLIATVLAHPM